MYSYENLKENHGKKVNQTIDSPILIFEYFELAEAFASLFVVMFFGTILNMWPLMFCALFLVLGVGPIIRRRNERGIYFHYLYRKFGITLPGLINPQGPKKYSD